MRNKWCLMMAFCAMAAVASAAVTIYQEDFDGPAGVNLNGRTPTVAPAGVTWVAGADFKANGQVIWDNVPFGASAYLPFSPQIGNIYEYTCWVNMTSSDTGNDWAAMGFTEFNTVPESRFFNDNGERNPRYWMLSRVVGASQNDQTFVGPGTGDGQEASTRSASNLKIVLNTTAPTWTVSWYFNDILVRTVDVIEENENLLNYLALTTNRTTGTIDNFKLAAKPFVPWGPSPANGAAAQNPMVEFAWNKALDPNDHDASNPGIVSHILNYVTWNLDDADAEPNFLHPNAVSIPVTDSAEPVSSGPITLAPDLRVFWRVDHVLSSGGPIIGPAWQFATLRSAPLIGAGQPENIGVFAGQEAVFEAEFYSYSGPTPSWMKSVEGGDDLVIANNPWVTINPDKYEVELQTDDNENYVARLVVKDAETDDEGYYYLQVNSTGGVDVSRMASLQINRLLAHYPFNNSYADLLGGSEGVPQSNDSNYPTVQFTTDAIVGSHAVVLYSAQGQNTYGQYIDFGTEGYPKAGVGNGMETGTISMWIKPTKIGTLLCNLNDNVQIGEDSVGTTGFAFSLASATQPRMMIRGEGFENEYQEIGTVLGGSANLLADGRWHHVVTTWKAGSHVNLSVDGVEVESIGGGTPDQFLAWQHGVLLGASRTAADRQVLSGFYSGAIDDLQIFNYAKDKYGIAELYFEVTDERVCIDVYSSDFDFNGDCVVDIKDFAEFAAEWLSSGLYPL